MVFTKSSQGARMRSVAAAAAVAMACGTNYAYSAWAPEFGDKLKLSSTQENLIGTFGNLGNYSLGIPLGIMVDKYGSRPGSVLGALCLGLGYFGLWRSYNAGVDAPSMPWLCIFSYLTGVGSLSAFLGAVKTAALNWPSHRGTAVAFPMAGYGLSAFFFSVMSHLAFPDDTSGLLLLFTILTASVVSVGGALLRIVPQDTIHSDLLHQMELESRPATFKVERAAEANHSNEPGARPASSSQAASLLESPHLKSGNKPVLDTGDDDGDDDGVESLLSNESDEHPDETKHLRERNVQEHDNDGDDDDLRNLDIRGTKLLRMAKFWQIWIILGLLTGIGLMTINNIGSDARALWKQWEESTSLEFIQKKQLLYVETLSFFSFLGRLGGGIGSDILLHRYHQSRYLLLLLSSLLFLLAQSAGILIASPHLLAILASLTGLSYGILFGVCPTLVVEAFGERGLSQNWGIMTIAPIPFGNLFNLVYGNVFDGNSKGETNAVGEGLKVTECHAGVSCYRKAYVVTLVGSLVAVGVSLWSVRADWRHRRRREDGRHRREA